MIVGENPYYWFLPLYADDPKNGLHFEPRDELKAIYENRSIRFGGAFNEINQSYNYKNTDSSL